MQTCYIFNRARFYLYNILLHYRKRFFTKAKNIKIISWNTSLVILSCKYLSPSSVRNGIYFKIERNIAKWTSIGEKEKKEEKTYDLVRLLLSGFSAGNESHVEPRLHARVISFISPANIALPSEARNSRQRSTFAETSPRPVCQPLATSGTPGQKRGRNPDSAISATFIVSRVTRELYEETRATRTRDKRQLIT